MATTVIKNIKQIDKILEAYAKSALKNTQDAVAESIQESIVDYYKEYLPTDYSRTYKFLNSLVKTQIVREGNVIKCEVKIDEDYLRYAYPGQGFPHDLKATGLDVVRWANRNEVGYGNHGGSVDTGREEGFWEAGLQDLGGNTGILTIFINNLKRRNVNLS